MLTLAYLHLHAYTWILKLAYLLALQPGCLVKSVRNVCKYRKCSLGLITSLTHLFSRLITEGGQAHQKQTYIDRPFFYFAFANIFFIAIIARGLFSGYSSHQPPNHSNSELCTKKHYHFQPIISCVIQSSQFGCSCQQQASNSVQQVLSFLHLKSCM